MQKAIYATKVPLWHNFLWVVNYVSDLRSMVSIWRIRVTMALLKNYSHFPVQCSVIASAALTRERVLYFLPRKIKFYSLNVHVIHVKNLKAIFITLCVVIWFSTGTLGIFATLVTVFTVRVLIYDTLSIAINPTLSTFAIRI